MKMASTGNSNTVNGRRSDLLNKEAVPLANDKEMHPLSGDIVETDGVYRDNYGHEVELKAGEELPMDPQLGKMEYEMVAFASHDLRSDTHTDIGAAREAHIPVSAANEEEMENKQKRQLKHRLHGGNR
jgi:hypothetical protein